MCSFDSGYDCGFCSPKLCLRLSHDIATLMQILNASLNGTKLLELYVKLESNQRPVFLPKISHIYLLGECIVPPLDCPLRAADGLRHFWK